MIKYETEVFINIKNSIYEEGCLMTFEDVLKKYRTLPANKLKMSMHFEKMMKRFMQTYPVYLDKFSDVWICPP